MEQHIIEAVLSLLGVVGTGLLGYVANVVARFLLSKHLEVLAVQAVRYAADAYHQFSGETRLRHACSWVVEQINRTPFKFFHVTESQVEGFVRAAYNLLAEDLKKNLAK